MRPMWHRCRKLFIIEVPQFFTAALLWDFLLLQKQQQQQQVIPHTAIAEPRGAVLTDHGFYYTTKCEVLLLVLWSRATKTSASATFSSLTESETRLYFACFTDKIQAKSLISGFLNSERSTFMILHLVNKEEVSFQSCAPPQRQNNINPYQYSRSAAINHSWLIWEVSRLGCEANLWGKSM